VKLRAAVRGQRTDASTSGVGIVVLSHTLLKPLSDRDGEVCRRAGERFSPLLRRLSRSLSWPVNALPFSGVGAVESLSQSYTRPIDRFNGFWAALRIVRPSTQPAPNDGFHRTSDPAAGLMPVRTLREQAVVFGLSVTDVCQHGEIDRLAIKALGRGRPTNPVAILAARVLSNRALPSDGTCRISASDLRRELLHVLAISNLRRLRARMRSGGTCWCIRDAASLSRFESILLDQKALAFIATPGSAPLQYNRPKSRRPLGTPREGGISSWEKLEVVEVRAGQADGPFYFVQADPC